MEVVLAGGVEAGNVDQDAGLAGRLAACHLVPCCGVLREVKLSLSSPPPHRQRREAGGEEEGGGEFGHSLR